MVGGLVVPLVGSKRGDLGLPVALKVGSGVVHKGLKMVA